jgi:GNAT superfamily N-acetyltransferase
MTVTLSRPPPGDAPALTAIAFAAKRHWGYPEAWIQHWRAALTVAPEYVANNACFVAASDGEKIGFAAVRHEGTDAWIDHLWVMPQAMGQGIGRLLFRRCEEEARRNGATRLVVEADPHAEGFYVRLGARTVGRLASPMDGAERFLPVMAKKLS